ncbi:MAG TPA: hypothetical protein VNW92_13885 [Polyangiaceae bacterium]|jgi:hypothetical protein|nr:hypothetical protein [Polyangiaceae bacterium]
MPIVLVELPAADAADVNAPALIAACSSGLRRGTCVVEEGANGERAAAVAIVVWLDPEHLRARIDVGRRAEQRGGWQVRELTFHEQDAPVERWRSVGLAIAGVVGEATLLEPAKPAPAQVIAPEPVREPRPVTAPVRRFRVALGPTLETGVSADKPSLGAWLDAGWRYSRAWPLELTVGAANAWSLRESSGIASRFSTFGVGLSGTWRPSPSWGLRGSALAALEAVDASATDPSSGAHSSGARWLFGGLGRVQAVWPEPSPQACVLGLEITRLSGATDVRVHEQSVVVSPAWRGAVQAGVEWKF